MRFKFCGDADAPDWVLAEIATLSKISSVRIKLLVGQILKGLVDGNLDYEKVRRYLCQLHTRLRKMGNTIPSNTPGLLLLEIKQLPSTMIELSTLNTVGYNSDRSLHPSRKFEDMRTNVKLTFMETLGFIGF